MHYRSLFAHIRGFAFICLLALPCGWSESRFPPEKNRKQGETGLPKWVTKAHETSVIAQLKLLLRKSVQQEPGPPGVIPGLTSSIYLGNGMELVLWDGYSNPTEETKQMTILYGSGNPGFIEIPPATKINPDMLFEACSITKTFTAATVLRYQEIGSIDIHDSVKKWLPAIQRLPGLNCCEQEGGYCVGASDCPTIKDLLRMTSGIQDFTDGVWEPFLPERTEPGFFHELTHIHDPDKFWLPSFVYSNLVSYNPAFASGEGFLYSSTNYVMLGEICLNLANFFNLAGVYEEISEEVDLTNTHLGGYQPITRGTRALGWNGDQSAPARRAFLTAYWAAGGLVSTAENVAKWIYEMQQPGVVLSAESLKQMWDFYVFDQPIPVYKDVEGFYIKGYGLGLTWFVITPKANQSLKKAAKKGDLINLYGHSGGSWAFLSFALYDPDRKLSYGLMINKKSPAEFTSLTRDYVRIVSKHLPPIGLPEPPKLPKTKGKNGK